MGQKWRKMERGGEAAEREGLEEVRKNGNKKGTGETAVR